jgi:hypothetical protein
MLFRRLGPELHEGNPRRRLGIEDVFRRDAARFGFLVHVDKELILDHPALDNSAQNLCEVLQSFQSVQFHAPQP